MEKIETPKKVYCRKIISVCRICGEAKSQLQNIYSKVGKTKSLELKVKRCCGIDISEADIISKSICKPCESFVNKCYLFRQMSQQAQVSQRNQLVKKRCLLSPKVIIGSPSVRNPLKKKLKFDANDDEITTLYSNQTINWNNHASKKSSNDNVKQAILTDIKEKVNLLCTRGPNHSILLNKGYKNMSQLNFAEIFCEVQINFPFLVSVIHTMASKTQSPLTNELKQKISFIYTIIMNTRWHELSQMQRVNTVLMIEGGSSKKLQERFQKLGVCLSYSSRETLLTLLGGHFMDKTVEKLKAGSVFRGTGDNWDMKILKSHMRKDIQNQDLHLFASNLIENRVNFQHLQNETPKGNIAGLKISQIVLNKDEWQKYASTTQVLVARIICEFLPKFSIFKDVHPHHIPHPFSHLMKNKSSVATLPIIDADEKSYADCVKILRIYEKWIAELHHKAGLISKIPKTDEYSELSKGSHANPGQPAAQVLFTKDDPMKNYKIVFAGDQLTRVRFSGAKDLLQGTHTPSDRLEHCSPFKPVMWHTKASLLQYTYHLLFASESINEIGTLKYFREKLNRKNVTPNKVLDSYQGSEELLISLGKAYIVVAAMDFFGMKDLNDKPTKHNFPTNIVHATKEVKASYIKSVLGKFVDTFVLQKNYSDNEAEEDEVQNYALITIFLSILVMQMKDTAAEADGDRNLINQKILLVVFKSLNCYSKYAIEMFTSIAQIECTLTPRLAEEFKWGFFVNWRGGDGNNIEDDLAQENCNRVSKKIVQRMGANKSIAAISKVCKANNGIQEVIHNFDDQCNITNKSSHHTTRQSFHDELEMINDIRTISPFQNKERGYKSFPGIKRLPHRYLNVVKFHQWIEKCKMEWTTNHDEE